MNYGEKKEMIIAIEKKAEEPNLRITCHEERVYAAPATFYLNYADEWILEVEGHQYIVKQINHSPECPCKKN